MGCSIPFSMLRCGSCGESLKDAAPGKHQNSIVCSKCGAENMIFAAGAGASITEKESTRYESNLF